MNIDARADHIASTLKRCYSIALGILKIVNILKDFTNASLQIRSISIIPYFKLLNVLGFIRNDKTKQIKKLQKFLSCVT